MTRNATHGAQPLFAALASCLAPAARLISSPAAGLVLFGLALLAANPSWTNGAAALGRIDPYVYTGFFMDLKGHIASYGHTYYASRLPWILAGSAAYSIAEPETANLMLRVGLLLTGSAAFFATLRLLCRDSFPAAIGAMLFASHSRFLGAIATDYPDGAGIVLITLSFALLTAASRTRLRNPALLLAGAVMATMVATHIFLIAMLPVLGLWFLLLDRSDFRKLLTAGSLVCAGAAVAIAVFCVWSRYLGGPLLFFRSQSSTGLGLDGTVYAHPLSYWLFTSWTALPFLAAGVSLAVLVVAARQRPGPDLEGRRNAAIASAVLLLALVMFAVIQFARFPVLQFSFYASYLIPASLLVLATTIATQIPAVSGPGKSIALAICAVVLLAPLGGFSAVSVCYPECHWTRPTVLAMAVVVGVLSTGLLVRRPGLLMAGLVAFASLNVGVSNADLLKVPPEKSSQANSRALYRAVEDLAPYNEGNRLLFWYNHSDPNAGAFRSLASFYMYQYQLLGEDFPSLSAVEMRLYAPRLHPGSVVAVLRSTSEPLPGTNEFMEQLGLEMAPISSHSYGMRPVPFSITVVRVEARGFEEVRQLDNSDFHAVAGKVRSGQDGAISIQLNATPWNYAAMLPLPDDLLREFGDRTALISMEIDVGHGLVGVGLLNSSQDGFVTRQSIEGRGKHNVSLVVPSLADASALVIQNWDRETGGLVRLESVKVSVKGGP